MPAIIRKRSRSLAQDTQNQETLASNPDWSEGLELKIEYRSPGTLRLPNRKARRHPAKQLAKLEASVRRLGFICPVIVDGTGLVHAGVARLMVAQSMNLPSVPVIEIKHLTPTQLRIFALADNKIAEHAIWDNTALGIELSELAKTGEHPLELTGFDSCEIDKLILQLCPADMAPSEDVERPDEAPPISRIGDVFVIGSHRLICGDARKPEVYAALMGSARADMVFVDLPYNVKIEGNVSGLGRVRHGEFLMASGEMSREEFAQFLSAIFLQLVANSKAGSIHFACMDWRHQREMIDAGESNYTELKNLLVWNKTNAGLGTFYRSQHELIYAWKSGSAKHTNNFRLGETGRYRTNVLTYDGANTFRRGRQEDLAQHSTVKPTLLIADLIMDVSKVGEIVLDACAGSGTTILAAEQTKRRAYCIELDPKYVDVAIRRCEQRLGVSAVHEASGLSFAQLVEARDAANNMASEVVE